MVMRRLYTQPQYEDTAEYDPYTADEGFLRQVVGAPAPAPAPFNPVGFDWTKGAQNIDGTIYEPVFGPGYVSGEATYEQGPLSHYNKYQAAEKALGKPYEIYDPSGKLTGTGVFTKDDIGGGGFFGDLFSLTKTAATELAPLATFALGAGPLGGMLGGAAANALGISGLTAAQTAALGSSLGSAGITALQGGSLGDTLKAAVPGALAGFVNPVISEAVGNILPDQITGIQSVDDALIKGAQNIATAATKAVVTGQDIDVAGALLPAVAQGIADEYKLPVKQVTAGLQVASKLLQGGDLSAADLLRLGTSFTSPTKATAGKEASAGYGGADTGDFFDSEEAQAVQDDIDSILARYPEAAPAPFFPEFEEALLTQEPVVPTPAPFPDQRYEVAAPLPPAAFDLPEEVLSSLSPAPQPRPISALEQALFQEANVMPDTAQQVVTTGDKQEPLLPELPETVVPPPAPEEPRYINVTEGQPQQVEITGGGQSLGNLLADLGLVTKLPETPVIPTQDIPAIVAPPVTPPTIPAPPAAAPPAAAPAAPPTAPPPAAPAPAPAPKKQDDLALLMMLAAMMTPQQKEEEQYQLAQILGVDSPFGRIV